ncbi:uncharacterized protein [Rhodnius prolixus]|uniref:Transcription initiation factor TFIID subunit 9 n=1 Tax=Rhodnius prolixus TaxID=13249 RepID=T1I8N9_RHOPR
MPGPAKVYPQDALVIIELLKDFGIRNYEPDVVSQILEFGQRYVLSVLEDARVCSEHAQKRSIDHDDLKLAVMMQLESKFTTPPPRDLMLEVARPTNSVPLPYIKPLGGVSLPPKRNSILSCFYKPWKKKLPEPPRLLNLYGPVYRKHFVRTGQHGSNMYFTRGGRTYVRPAGGKAYQQLLQKRQQCVQQMPPRPRIYPSQQVPPLPFPYPKYMKPIVVYIKEEPVSPILEVEADLPPDYIEEDDG